MISKWQNFVLDLMYSEKSGGSDAWLPSCQLSLVAADFIPKRRRLLQTPAVWRVWVPQHTLYVPVARCCRSLAPLWTARSSVRSARRGVAGNGCVTWRHDLWSNTCETRDYTTFRTGNLTGNWAQAGGKPGTGPPPFLLKKSRSGKEGNKPNIKII